MELTKNVVWRVVKRGIAVIAVMACVAATMPSPVAAVTLPAAPSNVAATALSTTSIRVTWTDNANNESGFIVKKSTDGTTYTSAGTIGMNSSGYTVTNLSYNTQYWFKVFAYNIDGSSSEVMTPMGTFTLSNLPAAPTNLVASGLSTTSMSLQWMDNAIDENNFVIWKSTDGSNFSYVALISPHAATGQTSYTVSSLTPTTQYWFRVAAHSSLYGDSAYASTPGGTFTLDDPIPPSAPSNLSASAVSASTVQLIWIDNATTETKFKVAFSTDGISYTNVADVPANPGTGSMTYAVTNLVSNTNYWFKVTAYNAYGASTFPVIQQKTSVTLSAVQATVNSASQITVSWQGNAAQYYVENLTSGTNSGWVAATSYPFVGFACGTTYTFRVQGKAADGTLSSTVTVSATTSACSSSNSSNFNLPVSCPSLTSGSMVKVQGKSAIYTLNKNAEVLYFPTGDEFKSWNADDKYGGYVYISQTCFDDLAVPRSFPGAVNFRPGSYVVRKASNAQLYVVEPNNMLAKITASAAKSLYGSSYQVKVIADIFWPHYVNRGADITDARVHSGMLVSYNGKTWYVDGSEFREVTGSGFTANRFKTTFVHPVTSVMISGLLQGAIIDGSIDELSNRIQ